MSILLYHDPPAEVFDAHLAYLRRHYHFLPYAELVRALESGDWSGIPPRSLVVHLDDGYRGNAALLEVCERYDLRPTLFLCSHIAGTHRHYWSSLEKGAWQLRYLDPPRLLPKLAEETGFTPEREYPEREALDADELRAMGDRFDFQSHGRHHFSLPTLSDPELREEMLESRERVENLTGEPCEHFAFPYGDYGPRESEAARSAGYRTARTTEPGWVRPGSDPYRLPIVADVPPTASLRDLQAELTGLPRWLKRVAYKLLTRHLYAWRCHQFARRRYFRGDASGRAGRGLGRNG